MDLSTYCKALPKIELHAHLNGSVGTETLRKLQKIQNNPVNDQLISEIKNFKTLKECFRVFKIVHDLTDTIEAVYLATCDVIKDFHDDNVIYLELRTTPRAVNGKMTKNEYIKTIIKAIEDTSKVLSGIIVKLLISVDRKQGSLNADENIKLAIKFHEEYPKCVVGIDLSGDPEEGEACIKLFQDCRKVGLKIAAHCAEVPNENEIVDILNFKPNRLGHELCLTSNVKCATVPSYSEHHLGYLLKDKHPICLGTDDKAVFNVTLSGEYELAAKYFSLSNKDLLDLSMNAVEYCFANDEEKTFLKNKINKFGFDNLY
ncbi:adenosine deaminase-like protein isoform X2 [Aphidius gifuensis]|uniref:adenosine deaminase-like protein isoform X2 n=1 Tax=Aphidius gifuensis TaxID=684658 RepID=UPI001CDC255D|nr:adenosine deaminase-like protein isoform X2 [Aphidius gifuensis]